MLATLTDCFEHLECTVSDDTCLSRVAAANGGLQNPDFQSCSSKQTSCQTADANTTFRDDDCTAVFVLGEAALERFRACVTRDCPQINACITAIISP